MARWPQPTCSHTQLSCGAPSSSTHNSSDVRRKRTERNDVLGISRLFFFSTKVQGLPLPKDARNPGRYRVQSSDLPLPNSRRLTTYPHRAMRPSSEYETSFIRG